LSEPQGLVGEFSTPKVENPSSEELQLQWRYTNGLLAVIFSFGLIVTAVKSRKARSWQYGTSKWFRKSNTTLDLKQMCFFFFLCVCRLHLICLITPMIFILAFQFREATRLYCRLWCSSDGSVVDCSILYNAWRHSKWCS